MNKFGILRFLLVSIFIGTMSFISFAQEIKGISKDSMLILYNEFYLNSAVDKMPWNGSLKSCNCGTLDEEILKKAEMRLNFFRKIYGLHEVKFNPEFNKKAQAAALLSKANEELTHEPDKKAKCYSKDAAEGCNNSCLSFTDFENFPESSFLTAFMQDYGEENYFIGHRRWMLYSRLVEAGYGATDNTEALFTSLGISFEEIETPDCIPYPWTGAVPNQLIFPKWSFSIPDKYKVDFSKTVITMTTEAGKNIALEKLEVLEDYLDHTIVWNAKGLFDFSEGEPYNGLLPDEYLDKKIFVSIKNIVVDGRSKNYNYYIIPFIPE